MRNQWLAFWPLVAVGIGLWLGQSAWLAILLYHIGIVCAVARTPEALRLLRSGWSWGWAAAALPVGLITWFSVRLLLPSLVGEPAGELWRGMPARLAAVGLSGPSFLVFALYFGTVHAILEDLAWHSVLRANNTERWIESQDFWFALYHLPVLLYLFPGAWALAGLSCVVLVTASAIWRRIALQTGGLQSLTLQHAAADTAILLAVWS